MPKPAHRADAPSAMPVKNAAAHAPHAEISTHRSALLPSCPASSFCRWGFFTTSTSTPATGARNAAREKKKTWSRKINLTRLGKPSILPAMQAPPGAPVAGSKRFDSKTRNVQRRRYRPRKSGFSFEPTACQPYPSTTPDATFGQSS